MSNEPTILMDREQSTMVSSWTEILGIEDSGDGHWTLAVYGYNWLGSIHDLIPEDERYDEDGGFKIPHEYDGHRIRGLADGEYLETDELVRNQDEESVTFNKASVKLAREYAARNHWDKQQGFQAAWKQLVEIVGNPAVESPEPPSPSRTGQRRRERIPGLPAKLRYTAKQLKAGVLNCQCGCECGKVATALWSGGGYTCSHCAAHTMTDEVVVLEV